MSTPPRQIDENATHFITRRTTQREFWLLPNAVVTSILGFCLAVATQRYGMLLHAYCFMSNHWHAVLSDPKAKLPEFCHWFHQQTSRAINAYFGRKENLWSAGGGTYSDTIIYDAGAEVRESIYTMCNPVKSGLVAKGDDWQGLRSRPSDILQSRIFERPSYFREKGPVPATAELKVTKLPSLAHLSDDEYIAQMNQAVAAEEQKLRRKNRLAGKPCRAGRRTRRQQRSRRRQAIQQHAKRLEVKRATSPDRLGPAPLVAASSPEAERAGIARVRAFRAAYRETYLRRSLGDKTQKYPPGSYRPRDDAPIARAGPLVDGVTLHAPSPADDP